jgi:hypothetical protein
LHPHTASGIAGAPATAELGINDRSVGGPDSGHAPGSGIGHDAAVTTGAPLPAPVILTSSALLLALLAIISFADFSPSDDGVNTIDTTQVPFAARLPTQLADGTNSGFDDAIELMSIAIEFGLRMVAVLGTPGIKGGSLPKLSFFGETPSFLILVDGLSATVAEAALTSTNAQSKSDSKPRAAVIDRANDLKRFVNNQFPLCAHVITSDSSLAQVAATGMS